MAAIDHGWSLLSEAEPFQFEGFSHAEEYISIKGAFKKAGKAIKRGFEKAGDNLKRGFESTAKGIDSSFKALGKCKPADAKCIAKNLGNALKGITMLGFPIYTAVAAEVGGGNIEKGYTMIGKQMYSISGIEGIVETCKAIKACNGNPACIAKNVGMLIVGIAAIAANAIPGVGEAADAAMVAERAAMIAEKAAIAAQDARKIAKTAEAIKKAENAEKKATEISSAIKADKAAGRAPQSTAKTREKFKELNDKLQQIQPQGTSQPPPDYKPPPDAPINTGITGTQAAVGAAAVAALAGGAYLATRGRKETPDEAGGEPPGEAGGEPPGEAGGAGETGGRGVKVIEHPINISLEMSGHDAMFGTSGYDDRTTYAWFLIFFLIICIIIVE
jgi:hypothetical protein